MANHSLCPAVQNRFRNPSWSHTMMVNLDDLHPVIFRSMPPEPSTDVKASTIHFPEGLTIFLLVLVLLLSILVGCLSWYIRRLKKQLAVALTTPSAATPTTSSASTRTDTGNQNFTLADLLTATNNFSMQNRVGSGGSADVFRGELIDGSVVAVKNLKSTPQALDLFNKEVNLLTKIKHNNIVELMGYVKEGGHFLIVYEFLSKTLDELLHGGGDPPPFETRLNISIDIARALASLHDEHDLVHRDVKASNILVSDNNIAKVADFGLAIEADASTKLAGVGTFGYMDPVYALTGTISKESDVYSFGILLLQIITGRKPIDDSLGDAGIKKWIRPLLAAFVKSGEVRTFIDGRMIEFNQVEMTRLIQCAAICTRTLPENRPSMSNAWRLLTGEVSFEDLLLDVLSPVDEEISHPLVTMAELLQDLEQESEE